MGLEDDVSLHRHIRSQLASIRELMDERDRLYLTNFKASEVAVAAALAGSEKAVAAAFLASEKAVLKAEQAQKEYNERSNEFRGQLDDQAKMLMPRAEADSRFTSVEEKISAMQKSFDDQIQGLRRSRDQGSGRDEALHDSRQQNNWIIGAVIGVAVSIVTVILHLLK
jgi:hypothetical protein